MARGRSAYIPQPSMMYSQNAGGGKGASGSPSTPHCANIAIIRNWKQGFASVWLDPFHGKNWVRTALEKSESTTRNAVGQVRHMRGLQGSAGRAQNSVRIASVIAQPSSSGRCAGTAILVADCTCLCPTGSYDARPFA